MRKVLPLVFLVLALACVSAPSRRPSRTSGETSLAIAAGGVEHRFTRAQLLASPQLKKVTVDKDPAYGGKTMIYDAVPLASLFVGIKVEATQTLIFNCLDGFSAPISTGRVLNLDRRQSVAYVAIESPDRAWPALKPNSSASAGPFYLIWENPAASGIRIEEWPFQLAGFTLKASLESEFPKTIPDPKLPAQSKIRRGYALFAQNCFACHTMNGEGQSQLGPDLNIPHNPTEYMKPVFLKKLVRNPQDLRHWPQSKMSGFNSVVLSDQELDDILAYLKHMTGRRFGAKF